MGSGSLPPLYLVTDRHNTGRRPLLDVVQMALDAGVRLVQLREKDLDTRQLLVLAEKCLVLTRAYGARLLVNDRLDIVQALEADGVHLRAQSLPVRVARQLSGGRFLIGVSAHSIQEVLAAEREGADFVVLGPVYDTPSKRAFGAPLGLEVLREACRQSRMPVFAIGGISPNRVPVVKQAGAYGVAVISGILASEQVEKAVREFLASLAECSTLQVDRMKYNTREKHKTNDCAQGKFG